MKGIHQLSFSLVSAGCTTKKQIKPGAGDLLFFSLDQYIFKSFNTGTIIRNLSVSCNYLNMLFLIKLFESS